MVSLYDTWDERAFCGATIGKYILRNYLFIIAFKLQFYIVSSRYALTAAHCIKHQDLQDTMIIAGQHQLGKLNLNFYN